MDSGKEVPVSRMRSKEFSDVVLQYMKNISIVRKTEWSNM